MTPIRIHRVLAMTAVNVIPAIIIAGASGVATSLQTIGIGLVGAWLPVAQGTSLALILIMIPLLAGSQR